MDYIKKYKNPSKTLPTYKGKPTTQDKVGNFLKSTAQYVSESLPQFGMNVPFDALRDVGVKLPNWMPTGYQGSYGSDQSVGQFAKGLINNAGETAAIDMGFGLAGKGIQVAAPYIKKGAQKAGQYALQKAEPYLTGIKPTPMMPGYKPKMNFIASESGGKTIIEDNGKIVWVGKSADDFLAKTKATKLYTPISDDQVNSAFSNNGILSSRVGSNLTPVFLNRRGAPYYIEHINFKPEEILPGRIVKGSGNNATVKHDVLDKFKFDLLNDENINFYEGNRLVPKEELSRYINSKKQGGKLLPRR